MRIRNFILPITAIIMLVGCESLHLRDPFLPDQVPDDAKQEERLVTSVDPDTVPKNSYPRLGDMPYKPKDFSPKPAYTHYMDELEFQRAESEKAKLQVDAESPTLPTPVTPPAASEVSGLVPPQLPPVSSQ